MGCTNSLDLRDQNGDNPLTNIQILPGIRATLLWLRIPRYAKWVSLHFVRVDYTTYPSYSRCCWPPRLVPLTHAATASHVSRVPCVASAVPITTTMPSPLKSKPSLAGDALKATYLPVCFSSRRRWGRAPQARCSHVIDYLSGNREMSPSHRAEIPYLPYGRSVSASSHW